VAPHGSPPVLYAVYGRASNALDGGEPAVVGTITPTGQGLRFEYTDSWRSGAQPFPVSVCMPLAQSLHEGPHVRNFLEALLPDNLRVRSEWARRFQVSASNTYGLLAHVGADVAGALQYLPDPSASVTDSAGEAPLTSAQIATFIREGQREAATWAIAGSPGRFSLAGQQAKVALHYDGDAWYLPSRNRPSTHIVKPGLVGYNHSAECEYLTMKLAAAVGLATAKVDLVEYEGVVAVAVARFDREQRADGAVVRVHQEDLCQALGADPALRYESEGGPSVAQLGDLFARSQVARTAVESKRALFDAVAFNWLTLGTDAHARNYSIQHLPGRTRFAPLYDLMSAAPYPTQINLRDRRTRLAQSVGGEYRFTAVRERHWERLGRALGRSGTDSGARVRQLAEDVSFRVDEVAASAASLGGFVELWRDSLHVWLDCATRYLDSA